MWLPVVVVPLALVAVLPAFGSTLRRVAGYAVVGVAELAVVAYLAGSNRPGALVDAILRGWPRIVSTAWPSPPRPELVVFVALLVVVAAIGTVELARQRSVRRRLAHPVDGAGCRARRARCPRRPRARVVVVDLGDRCAVGAPRRRRPAVGLGTAPTGLGGTAAGRRGRHAARARCDGGGGVRPRRPCRPTRRSERAARSDRDAEPARRGRRRADDEPARRAAPDRGAAGRSVAIVRARPLRRRLLVGRSGASVRSVAS